MTASQIEAAPLAAARALAPEIAARAAEIETARRLPADLARRMARGGAYSLLIPEAYGGAQAHPRLFAEVVEAYAIGEASAGWCAMIAATTGLLAAYLDPGEARAIFGGPETIAGGVFAPMGKATAQGDHYRVSGRWAWGSGSPNCDWLFGGCLVIEDGAPRRLPNGAPDSRMVGFPAAEAELIDSWRVAGLCGTGSGDFSVAELTVPKARSVSLLSDAPQASGPLYAFPAFGLLAVGVAAAALGNARAALDAVAAQLMAKRPGGPARSPAERATVQRDLAIAEAAHRAARALLMEEIETAFDEAAAGGPLTTERRAALRLAATHAARSSAETTRRAYDLGGGAALYLDNALQRRFRDAHAMTQHVMVAAPSFELAGRAILGQSLEGSLL